MLSNKQLQLVEPDIFGLQPKIFGYTARLSVCSFFSCSRKAQRETYNAFDRLLIMIVEIKTIVHRRWYWTPFVACIEWGHAHIYDFGYGYAHARACLHVRAP